MQIENPHAKNVAPALSGPSGQAWLAVLPEEHRLASVAYWLLHCPGAHPVWAWYIVACIHLRAEEGLGDAHKAFPEATHELVVFAVNPEVALDPAKPVEWMANRLTPQNVVQQFQVGTDSDAERVVYALMAAFCDGRLSPDSDHQRSMSGAILGTADHIRQGLHPVS